MRRVIAACGVVAAVIAPAAAAQDGNRATDILAATREAIGGKRVETLQTFSVQGSAKRNVGQMQMDSDLELLLQMPDKYARAETMNNGMHGGTTTGFNGDQPLTPARGGAGGGAGVVVFRSGPGGPAPSGEKLSPEEQEKANRMSVKASRTELSRLMLGWFASAHPSLHATYAYSGEAESPDGKAYVIDVTNADGFAARLFIDEATRLPLMVTYQGPQPRTLQMSGASGASPADLQKQIDELRKQPPTMIEYRLFFEDWQDVDGIKFPFKLRRAMGETTVEEWSIGRVKVNPKIDPKKFAIES